MAQFGIGYGFGETAENFSLAVARFSFSPSEVKFWTT